MAKGPGKHRVTSTDVARACGVSRATVSYVLNNDPHQTIPPETRERVLQAAQELGYSPFAPARLLRSGQSQLVLAVLPFEQLDPALSLSLKELEQRLALHDLTLLSYVGVHPQIGTMHPSAHITPSVLLSYADQADPLAAAFLQPFHAPVLHLLGGARVGEQIGHMQAEYLIQGGKRSLIFFASERKDVQRLSDDRFHGVRQACLQWACEEPRFSMLPESREDARTVVRDALATGTPPWGICCYNDEVAFGVLAALADEQVAIPLTVAVVGCDNIPLAQWSLPALTTIAFKDESKLDPLIEAIVALSHGEAASWEPTSTLRLIKRASA